MSQTINYEHIATIVIEMYHKQDTLKLRPMLAKKNVRSSNIGPNSSDKKKHSLESNDACYLRVEEQYSTIPGYEPLDLLLKKIICSNIPPVTKITQNGIDRDKLKKGIELIKIEINNIISKNKNNTDSELNLTLENMQKDLNKLEEKYQECLINGNFEETINYRNIAIKTLKILSEGDESAEKLHALIEKKLGIQKKTNSWEQRNLFRQYEYHRDPPETQYNNYSDNRQHNNYSDNRQYNNYSDNRQYNKKFITNEEQTTKYVQPTKKQDTLNIKNQNLFPTLLPLQPTVTYTMGAWNKPLSKEQIMTKPDPPVEQHTDKLTDESIKEQDNEPKKLTKKEKKDKTKKQIQEPIKEPMQEPIQEPMQEPIKEPMQDPIKEPIKEPIKKPIHNIFNTNFAEKCINSNSWI